MLTNLQRRVQKCILMTSNAFHIHSIVDVMLKSRNHSFCYCKTDNSWWPWGRFGTQLLTFCGRKLHLERLPWLTRRHVWPTGALSICYACWSFKHITGKRLLYCFLTCAFPIDVSQTSLFNHRRGVHQWLFSKNTWKQLLFFEKRNIPGGHSGPVGPYWVQKPPLWAPAVLS